MSLNKPVNTKSSMKLKKCFKCRFVSDFLFSAQETISLFLFKEKFVLKEQIYMWVYEYLK